MTLTIDWDQIGSDGTQTLTQNGQSVVVSVSTPQNAQGKEWFVENGMLKNWDVTTDSSADIRFDQEVENVTFTLLDVDAIDEITIMTKNAEGELVEVEFEATGVHAVNGNVVTGTQTNAPGPGATNDGQDIQIAIPGPVMTLWIVLDYGPERSYSGAVAVSDISFDLIAELDGYVDGTAGDDRIDTDYAGDPQGDRVDSNDEILPGEGAQDDVILAGDGEDFVLVGDGDDEVYGGNDDDTLYGQDGDDTMYGGNGDDILEGMLGNDLLFGQDGDDYITGDEGNDVLVGGLGNDEIIAGIGDDVTQGGKGDDTLNMGDGNDVAYGGAGADNIVGGGGNDTLIGGGRSFDGTIDFNDLSSGDLVDGQYLANGVHIYSADPHNPVMIFDSANPTGGDDDLASNTLGNVLILSEDRDGSDADDNATGGTFVFEFDGPAHVGSLDFKDIEGGAWIKLYDMNGTQIGQVDTARTADGGELHQAINVDGVVRMEVIIRGSGAIDNLSYTLDGEALDEGDVINGGNGDDYIDGQAGDDVISGGSGADTLIGGAGNDMIGGGQGADEIFGGAGDDKVEASGGNDVIYGGAGNDDLWASEGDDLVYGGLGDDSIDGGHGVDTLYGDEGNDEISGGSSGDTLYGGEGEDVIYGDRVRAYKGDAGVAGDDLIYGGNDNDSISGNAGNDIVYGDAGDDTLNGNVGDDSLFGGAGNDVINGGLGSDYIEGNDGDDQLNGQTGDDEIYGGADNDIVNGGGGNDELFGGAGNDTIEGSEGNDTLVGAAGDDDLWGGLDDDLVDGGKGDDTIAGEDGDDTLYGGVGNDTAFGGAGDDIIDTSNRNIIDTSNPNANALPDVGYPAQPSATIPGLVFPGFDADTDPNNDKDVVDGGAGNDTIITGDDDDIITGGAGNDTINAGFDDDTVTGDAGDDFIEGGEGNDSIDGGAGDDVIYGQDDDDTLFGGSGDDQLFGGVDDDVIEGGEGADEAFGGTGSDVFFGGNGGDVVVGGEDTDDGDNDVLDLTGSNVDFVTYVDGDPEAGTVTFLDGSTMTFSEIENVIPCFTPGTTVATPKGERLVEELEVGDRIITRDNGIQEIAWLGTKDVTGKQLVQNPHLKPILIKAGALGHGLPERDMLVSPNHRVLVSSEKTQLYFEESEVLAAAKHMVGADGIHAIDVMSTTYIHFMFERHEVVLSNGAWTESFQPGDYSLKGIGNSQRNEIMELFPDLATKTGLEGYQSARKALKKHEAKLLIK